MAPRFDAAGPTLRTAVYVDGFNFYYWLKSTPFRWVHVEHLVRRVINYGPHRHDIVCLKYFTARIADTATDRAKAIRQVAYLRAIAAASPTLRVYYGEFRRRRKWLPTVSSNGGVGTSAEVWTTEEKGSDVNLAVHLVDAAWADAFDAAIVISNDSDLKSALSLVKRRGKRVGVLVRGDASIVSLRKASHFQIRLTTRDLQESLLPREIPGTSIHIPPEWAAKETAAGIRRPWQATSTAAR